MYDASILIDEFSGMVGILSSDFQTIPEILSPLNQSSSGIWINNRHPLCSLDNIFYASPDFNPNNWKSWVNESSYKAKSIVNYLGKLYRCTVASNPSVTNPDVDSNWVLYNPFQGWLQSKYNQAVTNLFDEVFMRKKLNESSKDILENQQLYRGSGRSSNVIISDGSFVGFSMKATSAIGLKIILNSIGIQSTVQQEDMTWYMYHTSKLNYLNNWELDIDEAFSFTWKDLKDNDDKFNAVLNYMDYDTNGYVIFGYYQEDLVGNAISKDWDCSSAPHFGCCGDDLYMYNIWSQYTSFKNIKIPKTGLNEDRTLPDLSKAIFDTNTNWGMNMSLTVSCDATKTIVDYKKTYASPLSYQFAKELLYSIAMSSRINPTNNQIQSQARADLDLKFPGAWIREYNNAIDAMSIDLSGFSNACLPCKKKNKVQWGTI